MSSRQAAEHARLAATVSVGCLLGSHAFAHCDLAIPRLAAGWTDSLFPAADAAGFTENAAPPLRVGLPYTWDTADTF